MTQKHKEKDNHQTQGFDEVVLGDDVEEDMRLMEEWNRPPNEVQEVTPENTNEEGTEVAVINRAIQQEGN